MEALRWAREPRPGLGLAASAVLYVLADRANDTGQAWPTIEMIAESLDCDRTTVIRAIQKLKRADLVTTRKVGRHHVYSVAIGRFLQPIADPIGRSLQPDRSLSATEKVAESDPKPKKPKEANRALTREDENQRPAAAAYKRNDELVRDTVEVDPDWLAAARQWLDQAEPQR